MFIEMNRNDSESESTDSDNNNEEPYFYDYYLRDRLVAHGEYEDVDFDDDSNSDFGIHAEYSRYGSSTGEVWFSILSIKLFLLILL